MSWRDKNWRPLRKGGHPIEQVDRTRPPVFYEFDHRGRLIEVRKAA